VERWSSLSNQGGEEGLYQRDKRYYTMSLRSYADPLKSGLRILLIVLDIVPLMIAKR